MTICNQHPSSKTSMAMHAKPLLKKESKISSMTPQQMKMKVCNSEAGDKKLTGKARKTYMSQCLKKNT